MCRVSLGNGLILTTELATHKITYAHNFTYSPPTLEKKWTTRKKSEMKTVRAERSRWACLINPVTQAAKCKRNNVGELKKKERRTKEIEKGR